ncbi:MAG: hypothetical protein NVSMB56_08910 [Pyrinomonadaceae bacterium]
MSDLIDKKNNTALIERALRKLFGNMGATLDRKLGRDANTGALTTAQLIARMRRLIDERVRTDKQRGRIAPHYLKLKIEWGKHSEALPETIKTLEHELLAAAIDHINDSRLKTLAPVEIESVPDIFTTGISVDPTYGEFEDDLKRAAETTPHANAKEIPAPDKTSGDVIVTARISANGTSETRALKIKPGGRRINVGRVSDNEFCINHRSVSKIHAAWHMNNDGTLLVTDTGSTNGTFINGRRIAYGEVRALDDGDVISFGDVEVRLKKQ